MEEGQKDSYHVLFLAFRRVHKKNCLDRFTHGEIVFFCKTLKPIVP